MKKAVLMYLPVMHQGYIKFLENSSGAETLLILGRSITHTNRAFLKDLRALEPTVAAEMVATLNFFKEIEVVEVDNITIKTKDFDEIIMPDEDICREVQEKYLDSINVKFINTFLRWTSDSAKAHKHVESAIEQVVDGEIASLMKSLEKEAEQSVDQYRQVGAAVMKKGEFCICNHNKIVPSIYTLFYEGDPRSQFKKGIHLDLSLALHGEAGLVALAAKKGLCLNGADMFVTDFPCPPCAKQIAFSGIKRLFFLRGYAVLDGERILLDEGAEIIKIKYA